MRFCDCLRLWAPRAAGRKKPRFTKNPGPSFTGLPILSLYSSNDFSRPLSLLVMAGIAFATVSHAGALGLPWGVGSGDCLSVLGALDAQNTILAPFRRGKDDVPGARASRRALGRAPVFLTCLDVFAFSRLGARGICFLSTARGGCRAHTFLLLKVGSLKVDWPTGAKLLCHFAQRWAGHTWATPRPIKRQLCERPRLLK